MIRVMACRIRLLKELREEEVTSSEAKQRLVIDVAVIIDKARDDFERDGPAKSLDGLWSRKAARQIVDYLTSPIGAETPTCT